MALLVVAVENLDAELVLQIGNRHTQRRWCNKKGIRNIFKMQRFSHSEEVVNLLEGDHRRILFVRKN